MVLAQALRDAVLQAALQGKLTEQLESDSKVSDLLKNIEECREQIKKCKNSLNLESMNIKIPCQWKMVELNSILSFVDYRGKTPNKSSEGIFLITASNIKKGYMDYTRKEYISKEEYDNRQSRGITKKGDLLFTTEAPLGNVSLCDLEISSCGQRVITMQAYCENTVCLELFMYFLLSPAFQKELVDNCTGTTAKGIKAEKLKHLLIPFPPIEEQQRIVDRVNELMKKIDDYEKVEKELLALEQKFPDDMKNALLQAAMQGKLTKQLDSDSSVDEKLHNVETIKKSIINVEFEEKFLAEIPANWRYVCLGDLLFVARGGSPRPIQAYLTEDADGINWIKIGDTEINGKYICSTKEKILKEGIKKSRLVKKGDFLLTNSMSFGRPYILKIDGCIHDGWLVLSDENKCFEQDYLYWLLSSPLVFVQFSGMAAGGVVKNLNIDKVKSTVIPLPPVEEQQRIVERLEQLLPLCETL